MSQSSDVSATGTAWTVDFARFACRLAGADEDEWQSIAAIAILKELRRMAVLGVIYKPHWCASDWLIGRAIRAVQRERRSESAKCVGHAIASVAMHEAKHGALEAEDWWAARAGMLSDVERYALERVAQGETYHQLAEDLSRSPAACRQLVQRARRKLRNGDETKANSTPRRAAKPGQRSVAARARLHERVSPGPA